MCIVHIIILNIRECDGIGLSGFKFSHDIVRKNVFFFILQIDSVALGPLDGPAETC